jgi:hypothetical protein
VKERAMAVINVQRIILLIGIILIVLAAFGVAFPAVNLFELGVAVSFASFLVP